MKKIISFAIIAIISLSNSFAQELRVSPYKSVMDSIQKQLVRRNTTFEFGVGGVIGSVPFFEYGLNFKTKNNLYLYPYLRTVFGKYDDLDLVSFLYGLNARYYVYKFNKEPITFYLSGGLSDNGFINDDDYSFKSNGLENEIAIGCEVLNTFTRSTLNIEIGYISLPTIIDNSAYAQKYYVKKTYNNVKTNLGGVFINFKFGLFSYKNRVSKK